MKRISSLTFAFLILTAFGLQTVSAQITIKIPDIPRIKKPKAEPPRTGGGDDASVPPATVPTANSTGVGAPRADDGPRIIKTQLHVKIWQNHSYWPPKATEQLYNTTSWLPDIRFKVMGPVPGGSQLSVDVTRPDGSLWVSLDCPTEEIRADQTLTVETPREPPGGTKVFTTATGVYGFTIRLKNALTGQNQALFSGKFKVGKVDKSKGIPKFKNTVTYYVDHDWTLPLGLIWTVASSSSNLHLGASMWFKGVAGPKAAYLFYQGKQVASTKEAGDANPGVELNTFDNDAGDPRWELIDFTWYGANFTVPATSTHPSIFFLDKNPGDYEVKVLCGGALCREMKFSIGPDGKLVDNGLVAANKINSPYILVPVKVVGTLDGQWQPMAWKTDVFYGNPLQGFTAP